MSQTIHTFKLVTAPEFMPISMQIAKKQIKMEDVDADDDLIELQLGSAVEEAEIYLGRSLMKQTWAMYPVQWADKIIVGNHNPVLSITSVKYFDSDGVEQTIPSDQYKLSSASNQAVIQFNALFESPDLEEDNLEPIVIEMICGYNAGNESAQKGAVPKPIRSAILLKLSALYEMREDRKGDLMSRSDLMLHPYKVSFF